MGQLKNAVVVRKEKLIKRIIASGIYKDNERHLFELTLSDIEKIYTSLKKE